jgi:hypothetical protein
MNTLGRAGISGSLASAAISVALAVLARREGKHALQPTNATSHWLHGKRAGRVRKADISHTLFWAVLFEGLLGRRRASLLNIAGKAAATSAIAGAVDYGLMPKRLTPGWENAVSNRSVRTAFVVMALGLAAGALLSRRR